MKLQQTIYDKFSIVLFLAMCFLALPAMATAQHNTGALRNVSGNNTWMGGIHIAVGDLDSDETAMNQIYVSRISLLTGAFDGGVGVVDSRDAEAASKIRMLFDVRRNLRLTSDIVVDIPENNTAESFQVRNFIRGAQSSGTRIPVMKLIVADSKNQQGYLNIELKDVYITSYQTGGSPSADSGDDTPVESVQFVYGAMNVNYDRQTN